jgi:hypothetical protein
MGLFSKTGFFGKIWAGIKKDVSVVGTDVDDVFKDVQLVFLPEMIVITQDLNVALNSGLVTDVVDALSPELGGVPADILTIAKNAIPKVLETELGLQALGTAPTAAAEAAWASDAIEAFEGATALAKTKIYSTLATTLISDVNAGKAENATWVQWINIGQTAVEQVQAAIAAAKADPANASVLPPAAAPTPPVTPAT